MLYSDDQGIMANRSISLVPQPPHTSVERAKRVSESNSKECLKLRAHASMAFISWQTH